MTKYTRGLLTLAGALTIVAGIAAPSPAQSVDTVATVPFAFTAGTTSLPAGTYRLSTLADHTAVVIINGSQRSAVIISQPEGPSATDNEPRLVFDSVDGHYFLREIRLADKVGFTLPTTAERSERVAGHAKHDVVVVHAGH